MNTVGGIQVFAALKNVGNVLKTIPDFDALYEDQFYENVFYYLATDAEGAEIEDCAFLSDVTLITDAHLLEDYTTGTEADPAVAKVAPAAAPAPKAAPAPITPSDDVPAGKMSAAQEELLGDILNDNVLKPEPKKEEKKPEPKKDTAAAHAQQGSILRVDSRRIDNLLNLVSEAVINKASFNQLAMQNAAELSRFQ